MVNTVELDIFTSDEFVDKNATLPTVIVLNDKDNCGYFIPVSTMAKCGWIDFDEHQLVSHTFRSGGYCQLNGVNSKLNMMIPEKSGSLILCSKI